MTALWIVLGVIAFIVIAVVIWWVATYNALIGARNNVKESYSTMDVAMKKRYDLIPNAVETVKGYAKQEKEVLEGVIKARNSAFSANSVEEKQKAEGEVNKTLKSLFALSEAYPELKSNANFQELQEKLERMETEIANSRRYYNANVKDLNNLIERFPSNIIARKHNFEKEKMFEVANEEERQNVKVKFD